MSISGVSEDLNIRGSRGSQYPGLARVSISNIWHDVFKKASDVIRVKRDSDVFVKGLVPKG